MRERQQLDGALSGFTRLLRELDDNIELVSLGEEEGDESVDLGSRVGSEEAQSRSA